MKKKINVNRKGFFTNNHTQNMSKGDKPNGRLESKMTKRTSGLERALAGTTQETPSGEQGLPDLH